MLIKYQNIGDIALLLFRGGKLTDILRAMDKLTNSISLDRIPINPFVLDILRHEDE